MVSLKKTKTKFCLAATACAMLCWSGTGLVGCSRSRDGKGHAEAPGETEPSSQRAAVKSLETLVASTDMIVVDSESMISMPPELRRQFARVVASSTVKQGGIRMGEPVGKIPPPPTPPPGCVLWVLRKAGSADQGIRKESTLAVVEIYDEFGFAQVIQPGKAAFRLASERWGDIAGSVAKLRISGIEGQD